MKSKRIINKSVRLNYYLLLVIAIALFNLPNIDAQSARKSVGYDKILENLGRVLRKGNKRTLRDLGSLLDKPVTDTKVREILKKYTLFLPTEIDVDNVSKEDYLNFFYEKQDSIHFSDIIGAFYITPVEHRKNSFVPKALTSFNPSEPTEELRSLILAYKESLTKKNIGNIVDYINQIGALEHSKTNEFLRKELINLSLKNRNEEDRSAVFNALIINLKNDYTTETAKAIIERSKSEKLQSDIVIESLSHITNTGTDADWTLPQKLGFYENLVDSMGTINSIRSFGYEKIFSFRKNFFYEDVDYYGKLLCMSDEYPWIFQNAYQDLLSTKHPKMLFYLTAFLYKNRLESSNQFQVFITKSLSDITNLQNVLPDDLNNENEILKRLTYWGSQHKDFEWDETEKKFIDQKEVHVRTQNYEKLFRRLNSSNDSAAIASYIQLTSGEPTQIAELSKKYRSLLRNYNKNLPSLKYRFLDQTTYLTQFCQKNNIYYHPPGEMSILLNRLANTKDEEERYSLENELIKKVNFNNVTSLEYWACVYGRHYPNALSAGRILDWFYSRNWEELVRNQRNLRIFLKKSNIFNGIKANGICNSYLNKFDINNEEEQAILTELLKTESDADIVNQITQILVNHESVMNTDTIAIEPFIERPAYFTKTEIKVLARPTEKVLNSISENINSYKEAKDLIYIFHYLEQHASIDIVPYLFELLNNIEPFVKPSNKKIIENRVVGILEQIYNYQIKIAEESKVTAADSWTLLWQLNGNVYQNWRKQFLGQRIGELSQQEEIDVDDINYLLGSSDAKDEVLGKILSLVPKISPIKRIRKLNFMEKLSIEEHMKYFKDIKVTHKELDDIARFFEITDPDKILDFIEMKSTNFAQDDKGALYNDILRENWMMDHIHGNKLSKDKAGRIVEILQTYLNESDFLSEYEEQRTVLNINLLENIGLSLSDKIEASMNLDVDEGSKFLIQQAIIDRIAYEDIGIVAGFMEFLSQKPGHMPYDFLHKDFGLPIFKLEDPKAVKELIALHQKLGEYEFYIHYLKEFGVDFLNKKKKLDYNKINEILQFDIAAPFASDGGSLRDDYVYGLIKLLELTFDTRLGFHEKLNESQSFYKFTSSRRAAAWRKYLKEHNLLNKNKEVPPSFNETRYALK